MHKFRGFLFLMVFLGGFLNDSKAASANPLDFSQESCLAFASQVLKKYPEAQWLMGKDVKATLQGDKGTPATSWSLAHIDGHYIEFERTISSMRILHALYQGGPEAYAWFTRHQKKNEKLSRGSFDEASNLVQRTAQQYSLRLLEINLLLGDLGKTPEARRRAAEYGVTEGDHDIFLARCLAECPHIFPTYATLSATDQKIIQDNAGLLHFGHLMHVEGTATAMLSNLKGSHVLQKPDGFDFELVCHLCDIAAVLAHVNNEGSLVLTQDAYQTIREGMQAVRALAHKTENQALQVYLDLRAKRLELQMQDLQSRNVLSRLAAMMRITNPEEARLMQEAWKKIPDKSLIPTLDPLRTDQNIPTPTYVPAVLTNLRTSLSKEGLSKQDVMDAVINIALPWVMKVIQTYENGMGSTYPGGLTLNFNAVGGAVRDNPYALDNNPAFSIDHKTGDVTIA